MTEKIGIETLYSFGCSGCSVDQDFYLGNSRFSLDAASASYDQQSNEVLVVPSGTGMLLMENFDISQTKLLDCQLRPMQKIQSFSVSHDLSYIAVCISNGKSSTNCDAEIQNALPIIVFSMSDSSMHFTLQNTSNSDILLSAFTADGKYLLCVSKSPDNVLSLFSIGGRSLLGYTRLDVSGQIGRLGCSPTANVAFSSASDNGSKETTSDICACISTENLAIVVNFDFVEPTQKTSATGNKVAIEPHAQKQFSRFETCSILPTEDDNRKYLIRDHVWMQNSGQSSSDFQSQSNVKTNRWNASDSLENKEEASEDGSLLIVLCQAKNAKNRRSSFSADSLNFINDADSKGSKAGDSIISDESRQVINAGSENMEIPLLLVFQLQKHHSKKRHDDESSTVSSSKRSCHYYVEQEVPLPRTTSIFNSAEQTEQAPDTAKNKFYNCLRKISKNNGEKDGLVVGGDCGVVLICQWVNGVLHVSRFCSLSMNFSIRTVHLSLSSDFNSSENFHVICCVKAINGQKSLMTCKIDDIPLTTEENKPFKRLEKKNDVIGTALDDIAGWSTSGSSSDMSYLVSVSTARTRPIIASLWREAYGNIEKPLLTSSIRFWNLKSRKRDCIWTQDTNNAVGSLLQAAVLHPHGYSIVAGNSESLFSFSLVSDGLIQTGKLGVPLRLRSVVSEQELSRKRKKKSKSFAVGNDPDLTRTMLCFSNSGDKFVFAFSVCPSAILVCAMSPLSILHIFSSFSPSLNKLSSGGHDGLAQPEWDLNSVIWDKEGTSLTSTFQNGATTLWSSLTASTYSSVIAENSDIILNSSVGQVMIDAKFVAYTIESLKNHENDDDNQRDAAEKESQRSPSKPSHKSQKKLGKSDEKAESGFAAIQSLQASDSLIVEIHNSGSVTHQPCPSLMSNIAAQLHPSTDGTQGQRSKIRDDCLSSNNATSDCHITCWYMPENSDLLVLGTSVGTVKIYETAHLLRNLLSTAQEKSSLYVEHQVHQGPVGSIQAFCQANFVCSSAQSSSFDGMADARTKNETKQLLILTSGKLDGSCSVLKIDRSVVSSIVDPSKSESSLAVIDAVDISMIASEEKHSLDKEISTLTRKLVEVKDKHNQAMEGLELHFKQREDKLLESLKDEKAKLGKELELSVAQCESKLGELLQQLDSRDLEHSRVVLELENRYETRMVTQLERYDIAVEQSKVLKDQSDGYMQSQKIKHDKAVSNVEKEARERERRIRQECGHIQDELHTKEMTFKEILGQQETEYENEIRDLVVAAENEIKYERQETAKIQTVVQTRNTKLDGLMKKFQEMKNSSQAKQTLLMHERNERKRLEDQVEHMKRNILERDVVIAEKEKELAIVREGSRTLENFKIVLGHRLRELSEEKGPVSRRIEELEDHLRKMYDEMATSYDEKKDVERIVGQTNRRISSLTSEAMKLRQQLQEQGIMVTALKREIIVFASMARMLPPSLFSGDETNDTLKHLAKAILDCQKRFDHETGRGDGEAESHSISKSSESGTNAIVRAVCSDRSVDGSSVFSSSSAEHQAFESKLSHKKLIPLSQSIPYTSQQVTYSSKQTIVVQVEDELVEGIKDAHRMKKLLMRSNSDLNDKIKSVDKNTSRVMKENALLIQECNELRRENVCLRREMDKMLQDHKDAPTQQLKKPAVKHVESKSTIDDLPDDNSDLRPLSSTISSSSISLHSTEERHERKSRDKEKDDLKSEIMFMSKSADDQDKTIQMQRSEISSLKNLIRAMSGSQLPLDSMDRTQSSERMQDFDGPSLSHVRMPIVNKLKKVKPYVRSMADDQLKHVRRPSDASMMESSTSSSTLGKDLMDDLAMK